MPEGSAPARRAPQLTRWLYFSLLLLGSGYLIYLVLQTLFYIEVRGQVEVDKIQVSPARSGQLTDMNLTEGGQVKAGQLLARVLPDKACEQVEENPRIEKIRYEIRMLDGQVRLEQQRLSALRSTRKQYDLRRALEMDGSRQRDMLELDRNIDKSRLDIRLAQEELAIKKQALEELEATPIAPRPDCQPESLHAPFDARIITIHRRNHEYAGRGDPIVTLESLNAPVRIEAYADSRQYERWSAGDEVQVLFPDGSETAGHVEAVQSAAYNTPARQWDDYVPVEARLRIHLITQDKNAAHHWRSFDRMDVTVRMYR